MRMSSPGSRQWLVARLINFPRQIAAVISFENDASWAWYRRTIPLRGSLDSLAEGKTYCQRNSAGALGKGKQLESWW